MSTTLKTRRLAVTAAALAAAVTIAAILALGGSSSSGGGLGAELAEAAGNTSAVSSGVATAIVAAPGQTQETVVRFAGDDVEARFGDQLVRVVDGRGFARQADGSWDELSDGGETTADEITRADITDTAIVDLVRSAEGAVQDGDVYRARLSGAQLGGIDNALLALGDSPLAEGAVVEVEVANDLIRRVSVASGDVVRSVTYAELNQPQEIVAPG